MPTDIFKNYQSIYNTYDNDKNLCLVFPTLKCKKNPTFFKVYNDALSGVGMVGVFTMYPHFNYWYTV